MSSREEGALARAAIICEPKIMRGESMNVWLDGQQIFDWRWRLGVTQEQMARQAGISPQTLLRAENGKGAVTLKTARRLADLMGVTTQALERA
jgi:DNA-binding XRE family transcriptional regulator